MAPSNAKKRTKKSQKKKQEYVINPETGRRIKVGGPTWKRIMQKDYFADDAQMVDERHRKYCRCVAHVAAQQSDDCLRRLHSGYRPSVGDSKDCYLPYSVCTASTGRAGSGSGECLRHYNLRNIPQRERKAMAILKLGTDDVSALRKAQREARAKK